MWYHHFIRNTCVFVYMWKLKLNIKLNAKLYVSRYFDHQHLLNDFFTPNYGFIHLYLDIHLNESFYLKKMSVTLTNTIHMTGEMKHSNFLFHYMCVCTTKYAAFCFIFETIMAKLEQNNNNIDFLSHNWFHVVAFSSLCVALITHSLWWLKMWWNWRIMPYFLC